MGPLALAAIPAIGEMAGSLLGMAGQKQANFANAQEAQRNRDFQERMSNTSYQRAVADMKSAGLNPALAYQQGGSSSPSGTAARYENANASLKGSAAGAAQSFSDMRTANANRELTKAQTAKTAAEAQYTAAEAEARIRDLNTRADVSASNARDLETTRDARNKEQQYRTGTAYWTNRWLNDSYGARREELRAHIDGLRSNARESTSRAVLHELEQPGARNRARAEGSYWKKTWAPYMTDAKGVSQFVPSIILNRGRLLRR